MSLQTDDKSKAQFLVDELRSILNGNVTKNDIMNATLHGMLALRRFSDISGAEKKKILIEALGILIAQSELSAEDKVLADALMQFAVPEAIDMIASAANGVIKLKQSGLLSCLCC